MKLYLLAGTSLAALTLAGQADATGFTPVTFGYTGSVQHYTVPTAGYYEIQAFGAQGGAGDLGVGGLGAEVGGNVTLAAGEVLSIFVGGEGGTYSGVNGAVAGGGGGGSFVMGPSGLKLAIAGGGGGGYEAIGGNGLAATAGGTGTDHGRGGVGGTAGSGGGAGNSAAGGLFGAGGGGLASNGGAGGGASGGKSYANGLVGGSGVNGKGNGGFGGGGGVGSAGIYYGGGGGGGYSGGGGGGKYGSGGGGGSYVDAGNVFEISGGATAGGNGYVMITPVSEPASIGLLGFGLTGLLTVRRRRPG